MRIWIVWVFVLLSAWTLRTGRAAEPAADAQLGELVAEPVPVHASLPAPVNRLTGAAIWVNPLDASASRIVITNQARGIEVHDLAGYLLKHLDEGYETDSITILHGFRLAGRATDLVLATYPDKRVNGVAMWAISAEKAKLKPLPGSDRFVVPGNPDPRGITAYHSRKTDKCYAFVTATDGNIDQLELTSDKDGEITATPVRHLSVPSKTQGCVADEERGVVYFSEEKKGVWRFDAEPDGDQQGTMVIRVGEHGLIPDVEGIALYSLPEGKGYLIVVGQGSKTGRSRMNVYDRQDCHFVGAIVPSPANGNGVEFASAVAATSAPLPEFPAGLLLIRDHLNPNGSEDFKYYSWADCAKALHLETGSPVGSTATK
ncbi:MAG TPA: phytase [Lacipirellulaceae bacterium]|jgi:3-phytase|nr:phytase [Lacipirellulaceae bacterium]